MKNSKKLISAILMLALSFVMLVTSSFAWFSMNDEVKATGMTVSAKGDQIYLQIKGSAFVAEDDNGKEMTEYEVNNAAVELLPTSARVDLTTAFDLEDTSKKKGESFIWVTNAGKDAEDGTATGDYSKVDDSKVDKYVLATEMYIRLDPTSGATTAAKPLYVKGVNFGTGTCDVALKNCVSVMVVCGEFAQLWTNNGTTFTQAGGDDYLGESGFANSTTGALVTVYVFFNGDDPACTLKNLAEAKAATTNANTFTVDVSFSVV